MSEAVREVDNRESRLSDLPYVAHAGVSSRQSGVMPSGTESSRAKRPRNRTLQLQAQVEQAHTPVQRVEALLRLALWCAEAERSRARAATGDALAAAKKLRDPILLARARYAVALAAVYTHDEVAPYHDLLHLSREFETFGLQVDAAWCDLAAAMALENMGDAGGSVLLIERALGTFQRYDDLAGQSRCLNAIGVGECWVGRYAE
ncbi:MAG TPA: hypothetical protein VHU91_02330, partial [Mycobacteriales bacterium]|nr:hypothetical protein [Mycobacteriales bacterium]